MRSGSAWRVPEFGAFARELSEFRMLRSNINGMGSKVLNTVLPDGFELPGNFVRLQVVQQHGNPLLWELGGDVREGGRSNRHAGGEDLIEI